MNKKSKNPSDRLIKEILACNFEEIEIILREHPELSQEESWLGEYGMAAMRLAIEKRDINYIKLFQSHIPSINHLDSTEETLLDFACTQGSLETVEWLIASGAEVDGSIESPICPLISSICSENIELTKFIVNSGAQINRPHLRSLETPLDLAISLQNSEISSFLKEKGGQCTYSPRHFPRQFGAGILEHIQEKAGRILPFPKWKIGTDNKTEIMYSLANKNKHILLFTFGLHRRKIHAEICLVTPIEWNPLGGKRGNPFPVNLLLAITRNEKLLDSALSGIVIAKTDESLATLDWPINIEGFIFIDHKWHPPQKNDLEKHPDTATLFTGYPLTKKTINSAHQPEKIANYSWGKYCIPV